MPHPRKPKPEDDVLDDLTDLSDDQPDEGDFDEDDFTDLGDDQPEIDLSGLSDFLDDDDDDDDDDAGDLETIEDAGTDELDLGDFEGLVLDAEDDEDALDLPLDPLVLPWRTLAFLPDEGCDLPAILDPTRADSERRGPDAVPSAALRVQLDTLTLAVAVTATPSTEPMLILGRDALAGRILVSSE